MTTNTTTQYLAMRDTGPRASKNNARPRRRQSGTAAPCTLHNKPRGPRKATAGSDTVSSLPQASLYKRHHPSSVLETISLVLNIAFRLAVAVILIGLALFGGFLFS